MSFANSKAPGEGDGVGDHETHLPVDTAAVLALHAPRKWLDDVAKGMSAAAGSDLEAMTGLRLPEDLVTLPGHSTSLSVGGRAPADLDAVSGMAEVPLGLLVLRHPGASFWTNGDVAHGLVRLSLNSPPARTPDRRRIRVSPFGRWGPPPPRGGGPGRPGRRRGRDRACRR